MINKLHSNY